MPEKLVCTRTWPGPSFAVGWSTTSTHCGEVNCTVCGTPTFHPIGRAIRGGTHNLPADHCPTYVSPPGNSAAQSPPTPVVFTLLTVTTSAVKRLPGNQSSAGHLLWLVRTGRARTRGELQSYTGL